MGRFQLNVVSVYFVCLSWCGVAAGDQTGVVTPPTTSGLPTITESKAIPAIFTALLGNLVTSGAQALVASYNNSNQPANLGANTWDQNQIANPAPCYANTTDANKLSAVLRNELAREGCQVVAGFVGNLAQGITGNAPLFGSAQNQAQAQVTQPLAYAASGAPNYQGLKVSALIVNNNGQILEERPIGSRFYSGEKFRLKIQSSFPGFLEIMHTSPSGVTKRLFPRSEIGQFMLNAGTELVVPLGNNVYEFFGDAGIESLLLNIRDPRLTESSQASAQVYRQDMQAASYYAQSMADGQLPAISQPIQIQHSGSK